MGNCEKNWLQQRLKRQYGLNAHTAFSQTIEKPLWSRRVSNPRPNKEQLRFLHVYFVIGFRSKSEHKHPNLPLVSKILVDAPRLYTT